MKDRCFDYRYFDHLPFLLLQFCYRYFFITDLTIFVLLSILLTYTLASIRANATYNVFYLIPTYHLTHMVPSLSLFVSMCGQQLGCDGEEIS